MPSADNFLDIRGKIKRSADENDLVRLGFFDSLFIGFFGRAYCLDLFSIRLDLGGKRLCVKTSRI